MRFRVFSAHRPWVIWLLMLIAPALGKDPSVLHYRRIEIPQSHIESFVQGLLPRPRAEFERLVGRQPESLAEFGTAVYVATMMNDTLNGSCKLRRQATQDHRQFLKIGGTLAFSQAFWVEEDRRRPAVIGSEKGKVLVKANADDELLELSWSRRGRRMGDRVRFDLTVPDALMHALQLSLPRGVHLRANQGVVTSSASSIPDMTDWKVHWSADNFLSVVIGAEGLLRESIGVRTESSYGFRESGLRLMSRLHLDTRSLDFPPRRLRLALDHPLRITSIQCQGQSIPFTNMGDVYELDLSGVLPNEDRPIQVRAFADLVRGETFTLPRLRILGRWLSETMSWEVYDPLEISDLSLRGCTCTSIEQFDGFNERFHFSLEDETSRMQLSIDRAENDATVEALLAVALEENSAIADVQVQFRPVTRDLFDLVVDVDSNSGWIATDVVDAVSESPILGLPISVVDRFERQRSAERERILVRLQQPATFRQPVTLKLRLINDSIAKEGRLSDLMPLSFPAAAEAEVWIHSRKSPGIDFSTQGGQHAKWWRPNDPKLPLPRWIEQSVLASMERPAAQSMGDLLYRASIGSSLVRITRQAKASLAQVESRTSIFFDTDELRYVADIHVDPGGKETTELGVVFSQSVEGKWTLRDGRDLLAARQVNRRQGDPVSAVRYRIPLDPTNEPFDLRFETVNISTDRYTVPIMSIESSTSERGLITVHSNHAIGLEVTTDEGLLAVPFASLDASEGARIRAAYSYNDTSTAFPRMEIQREPFSTSAVLFSWRTDIRSFYSERGRPRHRADFYLQNKGAAVFHLNFPTGCALDEVEIDGKKLNPQPRISNGLLAVPLDPDVPFPCVSIRYVQPDRSLRVVDWLKPAIPQTRVPELQTTWHAWLPRDYAMYLEEDAEDDAGWLARLFGPFASRSGPRFPPSLRALRDTLWSASDGFSVIMKQIEVLLGADWLASGNSEESTGITWGHRLHEIQQSVARSRDGFRLLVDRPELRRLGIFPETPLPRSRHTVAGQIALDRLAQSGLSLVVDGSTVILTSTAEVRSKAKHARMAGGIGVQGRVDWFAATRLQDIEQWQTDRLSQLWQPSSDALETSLQRGGWVSRRQIAHDDTVARIYRRDAIGASACAVFLIGYALGWRNMSIGRRRWWVLCLTAIVVALAFPQPVATLARAFAWAACLGGITYAVSVGRRQLSLPNRPALLRLARTRAAVWLALPIVSFVVQAAAETHGAESDGTQQESQNLNPETFVYFPSTAEGELSEVVYLRREFYQLLKRRESANSLRPQYLLRRTRYSGDWPTDAATLSLQVQLEFTTHTVSAVVPLPEFGPDTTLDFDSVRADRRAIELIRNEESGRVFLSVARPSSFRVQFVVQVTIHQHADSQQMQLITPAVPDSRLHLNLPRNVAQLQVPTALGGVQADLTRGTVTADLGPSSRLEVKTRIVQDQRDPASGVDQFMLVKIDRERVEIESKFRFPRDPMPLRLKLDPQLEPDLDLNSGAKWNPETSELLLPASPQPVKLTMRRPARLGLLPLPMIETIETEVLVRRLAIDCPPGISAEVVSTGAEVLAEDEFISGWGGALVSSPRLFAKVRNGGMPTLSLTHTALAESWNIELAYFFDVLETRFEAVSQLTPDDGAIASLAVRHFKAPRNLRIHDVRATNSLGVPLHIRWRHDEDQLVMFFLDRPEASSTSPVDIVFSGFLESKQGLAELPLILPASSNETQISQSVVLYRSPEVDLDIDRLASVSLNLDEKNATPRSGYRYAGSWSGDFVSLVDQPPYAFAVEKRSAQRTLAGSLTTTMQHDDEGWSVVIKVDITSSDGIVDVVHLDVPESLVSQTPLAAEGGLSLRVDEVANGPGLDRRIVSIWLSQNATGSSSRTFELTARLQQEQTRLPEVRFLNVSIRETNGQPQQFVELPTRSQAVDDDSRFDWVTHGLTPVARTDEQNDFARFRVIQANFAASLDEVQSDDSPEVYLLETAVSLRTPTGFMGIARYHVKPGHHTRFVAEVPISSQVIQIFCDDRPVVLQETPTSSDPTRRAFEFQLTASPWPQRVRVVYRGRAPSDARRRIALYSPQLFLAEDRSRPVPVPVLKELWKVSSADGVIRRMVDVGDQVLEDQQYAETRIAAFRDLWEGAQISVRERPRDERSAWLRSWLKDFDDVSHEPAFQALLLEQSDALGSSSSDRETAHTPFAHLSDLWNESQWLAEDVLRCSSTTSEKKELPSLRVERATNRRSLAVGRYIAASLFTLAIFLPRWSVGRQIADGVGRYRYLCLVACGIAWWLMLSPRWLGPALVLAVAIVALIGTLRHKTLRLPSR